MNPTHYVHYVSELGIWTFLFNLVFFLLFLLIAWRAMKALERMSETSFLTLMEVKKLNGVGGKAISGKGEAARQRKLFAEFQREVDGVEKLPPLEQIAAFRDWLAKRGKGDE